jgi:Domain of unknown function (DUF4342)
MTTSQSRIEEHRVSGERLVARVKELIHQGNVRRIIVKNEAGQPILELPLTIGVVGAVLLPAFVALGAIAALAANYTLIVEKEAAGVETEGIPEAEACSCGSCSRS